VTDRHAPPRFFSSPFGDAMRHTAYLTLALLTCAAVLGTTEVHDKKKHHHHHHRHHHKHHQDAPIAAANATSVNAPEAKAAVPAKAEVRKAADVTVASSHMETKAMKSTQSTKSGAQGTKGSEEEIVNRMKKLEHELSTKEANRKATKEGQLEVNGPLPWDFASQFAQAVAKATGCLTSEVQVLSSKRVPQADGEDIEQVNFRAPVRVVQVVQDQAADPDSHLAHGTLRMFLVARDSPDAAPEAAADTDSGSAPTAAAAPQATQTTSDGIDVDTEMPYGELEPFGREDTAQELTEQSIKESDEMVDQLERAEVAEEKRAVFRALTRLRGAAITSFDGVARSQTGNIDEYNKLNKWRSTHPLHHLADEESDISKWAFPDNADF